ncbi:MAG: cobalamin B12-binding domain-containing protein [Candidatus Hodarchaeales archaeon]|jgi:methanogenic corrinoid protein MtbC1
MSHLINTDEFQDLVTNFQMGLRKNILEWFTKTDLTPRNQLDLLGSILQETGQLWNLGKLSLTDVYVISKIAEELMTQFKNDSEYISFQKSRKNRIVLGTISEDTHALGKNLVKRFIQPFFEVYDLGIDVSSEKFIEKAIIVQADIIAISALMMTSVIKIKEVRKLIDSQNWNVIKPKLLVGGAPFSLDKSLYKRMGADAFVLNAFDAVKKCMELLKE